MSVRDAKRFNLKKSHQWVHNGKVDLSGSQKPVEISEKY